MVVMFVFKDSLSIDTYWDKVNGSPYCLRKSIDLESPTNQVSKNHVSVALCSL